MRDRAQRHTRVGVSGRRTVVRPAGGDGRSGRRSRRASCVPTSRPRTGTPGPVPPATPAPWASASESDSLVRPDQGEHLAELAACRRPGRRRCPGSAGAGGTSSADGYAEERRRHPHSRPTVNADVGRGVRAGRRRSGTAGRGSAWSTAAPRWPRRCPMTQHEGPPTAGSASGRAATTASRTEETRRREAHRGRSSWPGAPGTTAPGRSCTIGTTSVEVAVRGGERAEQFEAAQPRRRRATATETICGASEHVPLEAGRSPVRGRASTCSAVSTRSATKLDVRVLAAAVDQLRITAGVACRARRASRTRPGPSSRSWPSAPDEVVERDLEPAGGQPRSTPARTSSSISTVSRISSTTLSGFEGHVQVADEELAGQVDEAACWSPTSLLEPELGERVHDHLAGGVRVAAGGDHRPSRAAPEEQLVRRRPRRSRS